MPPAKSEGDENSDPSYPPRAVEDEFPDACYFNPLRIYQASMTYLWWVGMMLSGRASTCGSFASHLSYYRREHAREYHGAGYHDSVWSILKWHALSTRAAWGFVLKRHLARQPSAQPSAHRKPSREGSIVSDDHS